MNLLTTNGLLCMPSDSALRTESLPCFESSFNVHQLHGRTEYPRREFIFAEAVHFTLGPLAGSGLDDEPENPFACLLHRRGAIQNFTAVDIHVFAHAAIHRRIGGQFQRRRWFAA